MNPLDLMTCDTFDVAFADYQRGALSPDDALRLERHAATCAACESRLDTWSRQALPGLSTFAPALPSSARDVVMQTISATAGEAPRDSWVLPRTPRLPRTWRAAFALAAAAVLAIAIWGRNISRSSVAPTVPSIATVATESIDVSAGTQTALRLADNDARSEFAALDAAATELESALAAAPNDRELRDYLSTVRARRDELALRVKRATL